jgi:hypothetical protein
MPATPHFISRVTRMEPAEAARGSLRLSMTNTAPGGQSSIALRCGWPQVLEDRDRVEVLARRDVAQRERLADHRRLCRIERQHAIWMRKPRL